MLARLERALQGVHAAPWQQERPALASVRPAERLEELASLCAVRERADRRGLGTDFELFPQLSAHGIIRTSKLALNTPVASLRDFSVAFLLW